MQTVGPDFTREDTDHMVKILDSTYVKAVRKQVFNNATQMNAEERTQLLSILEDFKDFFDVDLGDWATESVDL